MLALGFTTNKIAPCLFVKQTDGEFIIVAIYVDNINIFGTKNVTTQRIKL
jgi:hypothetical protein